ncbi:hypothetical protein BDV98DRAFT_560765 [Pterulicium gracile]|uniref:Gfd2/YDR514C-like C-terminal domain-containing protein n=1 Tax=Pterulicium gracile TaxID=1884261 RepID=A0A5C3QV04_9AGAR|nr:hypothetical protein BDV98DRAFT_560765 [Pterula gracilis]
MAVITGYYRYNDIWFAWPDALPGEDREALKAFLAHDSLVSPDHPFNEGDERGVMLYMGALANGERRLLVSTKQVSYARYWLHEMGLTKQLIPAPYAHCLLTTPRDLVSADPTFFAQGLDLKNAKKNVDKENKRLKKSHLPVVLSAKHDLFSRVREIWQAKKGIWIALDFEDWERDQTLLIEYGSSTTRWDNELEVNSHRHVILEGTPRNGKYVEDNRDRYQFGVSDTVSLNTLKQQVQTLFSGFQKAGVPLFLIFHDYKDDLKRLRRLGVPVETARHLLPASSTDLKFDDVYIVDTQDLFSALEGQKQKRKLKVMCERLHVFGSAFHNAGNDAHYAMLAFKEMMAHEPLDEQRERRWPGQGVTVEHPPVESESEDQGGYEAMFGAEAMPKE